MVMQIAWSWLCRQHQCSRAQCLHWCPSPWALLVLWLNLVSTSKVLWFREGANFWFCPGWWNTCYLCSVNFFGVFGGRLSLLTSSFKEHRGCEEGNTNMFLGRISNVERKLFFIVFVVLLKQRFRRWKCCSCRHYRWYCMLTVSFNVSV